MAVVIIKQRRDKVQINIKFDTTYTILNLMPTPNGAQLLKIEFSYALFSCWFVIKSMLHFLIVFSLQTTRPWINSHRIPPLMLHSFISLLGRLVLEC